MIMDYNRTVKDLNGLSEDEFIEKIKDNFEVTTLSEAKHPDKKVRFQCIYQENGICFLQRKSFLR